MAGEARTAPQERTNTQSFKQKDKKEKGIKYDMASPKVAKQDGSHWLLSLLSFTY
jgi:hypothetical protein